MSRINVHDGKKVVNLEVPEGANLLKILNKNGYNISNPCSGKGTCGKCKVIVESTAQELFPKEERLLGKKAIEDNYRLACYVKVENDMDIFLKTNKIKAVIVTEAKTERADIKLCPFVSKEYFKIEGSTLDNQKSDYDTIKRLLKIKNDINIDINVLRKIPQIISSDSTNATLVFHKDNILDIENGDTRDVLYGIGVDIGTTTIAAYLVNLNSGKIENVYSCLNPQKVYGDDVISRINFTMENEDGLKALNGSIIRCLNEGVDSLLKDSGINSQSIYSMVLAGNTIMLHLAMGLECKQIAVSPFIPVTTALHEFKADDLLIQINPNAIVSFLPCVSAYIGADTLCAILASNMHREHEISLLVDIGTNGEIALGSKKGIFTCSVAAGPAFEGAHLRNGIGGIVGAIDKVILTKIVHYTTIGEGEPIGICGSGIIDAIAQLLEIGIIDGTGRILELDELPKELDFELKNRIVVVDGMMAFLLHSHIDSAKNIYVTQRDIREIQNAKAAIAAGIKTLLKRSGFNFEDIDKVFLAGGFGNFINIDSAIKIGLLPRELKGKVISIGNAAGAGTVQTLISSKSYRQLEKIKENVEYIELSGNNDFTDLYISSMMLE